MDTIKKILKRLYYRVKELIKSLVNNLEGIAILSAATLGTSYVIGTSLFYTINLPFIIETEVLLFLISGIIVIGLTNIMVLRDNYSLYL